MPSLSLKLRVIAAITIVASLAAIGMILQAAWKLPAAAIPALIGGGVAVVRIVRRRTADDWIHRFDRDEATRDILLASSGCGAIGYMGLAAFGIGVPGPSVPLMWRAFGGFAVGATAGVVTYLLANVSLSAAMMVKLWRDSPILSRGERR